MVMMLMTRYYRRITSQNIEAESAKNGKNITDRMPIWHTMNLEEPK